MRTLKVTSVLSSGFVYSHVGTEFYSFERWINPASNDPAGDFTVMLKITAKTKLQALRVSEVPPPGFILVQGATRLSLAELTADQTITHVYVLKAGDSSGIYKIAGTISVERNGETSLPVEVTTPLYVFPHLELSSRDDPAWHSEDLIRW